MGIFKKIRKDDERDDTFTCRSPDRFASEENAQVTLKTEQSANSDHHSGPMRKLCAWARYCTAYFADCTMKSDILNVKQDSNCKFKNHELLRTSSLKQQLQRATQECSDEKIRIPVEATCAFECEFPEKVTVDDVLTHLKTTCPHVKVACPNEGCTTHVPREGLQSHRDVCGYGFDERCRCGVRLTRSDVLGHQMTCDNAVVQCKVPGCSEVLRRCDLQKHMEVATGVHARVASRLAKRLERQLAAGRADDGVPMGDGNSQKFYPQQITTHTRAESEVAIVGQQLKTMMPEANSLMPWYMLTSKDIRSHYQPHLERLSDYWGSPTAYARELMDVYFTKEELAVSSFKGNGKYAA
ncbi:Hypp6592 [Branchiostoma lanceolatum]|uniref:Hypp6592 protein n=1 Tax=Branchiostoma lanceolatum TaxID=7740 RepID=A0A8K0E778_BRALA|nr:Hypp6592 [Branchiostoma lanceolatum]